MSKTATTETHPKTSMTSNQADDARRQLENLRSKLADDNETAERLTLALREIGDKEKAARAILEAASPDSRDDRYDRQKATEALEALGEERAKMEERIRRLRVIMKSTKSQIDALPVAEIERRARIAGHAAKLGLR